MPLNQGHTYVEQVGARAKGRVLVDYLAAAYPHSPAPVWRARLAAGEVHLDGSPARGDEQLKAGQRLAWHRPPWEEPEAPLDWTPIFEDEAILAVDKPGGLPTLPGGGFLQNTLLHLVRARYPEASPVHRLGRGTSGLVLFTRTPEAAAALSKALRTRALKKRYRALAAGRATEDRYEIQAPIGTLPHPRLPSVHAAHTDGKASSSTARVLARRPDETLFEVDIHTGRPHQIRIHLAFIGHPLVGDPLYGPGGVPLAVSPGLPGDVGYLLHSESVAFAHPSTGAPIRLSSPPPPALVTG
jgi:23S rRNA pseudouridine1911/1915/1917 synthase